MKTYPKTGVAIFVGLLTLISANPCFALEVLTRTVYASNAYGSNQIQLQYTYYLDPAGREVLHGERKQYYLKVDQWYSMNQLAVIERYSHGIKHGLEEAWYQMSYSQTYQKHWEREYQNDQLHGVSKDWYANTGYMESLATYRYGKLHGPYRSYANDYYPYNQTLEANYQDGLLHGQYKKWIVKQVSGYWAQLQFEEGVYVYGKKQGFWKTWWTSASYPYYVKDDGYYGNDAKCGTWHTYSSTNGNLQTTTNLGSCQAATSPGIDPYDPDKTKYEIRGIVTDRDTNLPLAGVGVEAGGSGATSNADGSYRIVLDSSGDYTLNAAKEDYYDFSRAVSLTNTQYLNVNIAMKPVEAGGKPVITNVDAKGGEFFIEGFTANNEYVVSVNWNGGQPGVVRFEANGTLYEKNASTAGASHTFDMGVDFKGDLSLLGNKLKITAINQAGIESRPEILNPIVIPLPSWSMKFGEEFEIKQDGSHLVYKLDTKWPEKPIEILISEGYLGSTIWALWGFVPFVGGKSFGIPGTQAFLTVEAKTDGTGNIAAGGQSGFEAAGGKIEIKLGGKGNLKYEPNVGLEWKETSLILGIKGTIEDSAGPVTIIPALKGAVNLPVIGRAIGWFNEKAKIKGTITANAETALEIMSATGEIGFNKADLETGLGCELGMEVDVMEGFKAEVKGGNTIKINWQVPENPEYFKQMSTEFAATMTFKFLGFEWSENYTLPFTYPEAAGPQSVRIPQSVPTLKPLSRDFLNYGPYNVSADEGQRRAMDTGGAGAISEKKLIQNIFPHSEPAIAVQSTTARAPTAVAYVYLDPAKPVHRETDIYFTILTSYSSDGWVTHYYEATAPAPIKSDTRAEFAPTIAYDGNNKLIGVWQRVKNPEFPEDGTITDMAADMEIVYAVGTYNGTTYTWTEPVALTDNAYMDYSPILKRGANGNLMLVWFSNEGNLLVGSDAYPTTVHYAIWNKNTAAFEAPQALSQTIVNGFKFSLAYMSTTTATSATLAYTKDMDGDLTTLNDQEIFTVTYNGVNWGHALQLTADETPDANPQVVYRKNAADIVWLRDKAIVRLTATSPLTVETIQENVTAAGLIGFSLSTDSDGSTDGRLVLLRQDSDGKGVDLFYSVYDNAKSVWGNMLRLTESPAMEMNVQAVYGWPTIFNLVFNRKDMTTGVTDLYHKTFKLATDLAVAGADLSVEPAAPAPSDAVTLRCRVTNRGELAVANPVVKFYLGNPTAGGTLLLNGTVPVTPATLKAGEVGQAELAWTIPADITQYKIYAVVSAAGVTELSAANNTAGFDIIKPDLKAARCVLEQRPDGTRAIRAEIRNDSLLRSADNVVIQFRAQNTPIGTITVPGILPGKTAEVVLPADLDFYAYTSLQPLISVVADPDNLIAETNEENNTSSFIYALESVSPAIKDFGQVHYAGGSSTVTIFNKTTAGLAIGAISLEGTDAGQFRIFNTLSGTTLAAQQSALVGISFNPTSLGVKNAVLVIKSAQGKILWQVPLTGQLDNLLKGDVNDDTQVDLADAILALKAVAGLRPAGVYAAVDVDGDGRIGIAEAVYALQAAAEMR